MTPRLIGTRSSRQATALCLLFALLFAAAATIALANSAAPSADQPRVNSENSGAPNVSYPIDEFLDRCLAQPHHGSTASQVMCTNQARQRWGNEMNKDYRRLTEQLAPKIQRSLRVAQRRWLQYRCANDLFIDEVYELTKGTMYAPMQVYSHLRLVRERSLMLKSYFTALTNPKAGHDLPLAGKVKEDPENSGNVDVAYPADDSLGQCLEQHPTPSEQVSCVESALGTWDEDMNAVYQKLAARLPSKSTLADAQRTWIAFRDTEYRLIDSIYETLPSEEYPSLHAYWRLRLTRERALLLKKYLALAGTETVD